MAVRPPGVEGQSAGSENRPRAFLAIRFDTWLVARHRARA